MVAASHRPATDPATARDAGTAVFVTVAVAAVLTVVAGLLMPSGRAEEPDRGPALEGAAAG